MGTRFSLRGTVKLFCTLSPSEGATYKLRNTPSRGLQAGRDARKAHDPAASLHAVKAAVGGFQQLLHGAAILRKDGRADADRDGGIFAVGTEALADSFANALCGGRAGFRKHESKF